MTDSLATRLRRQAQELLDLAEVLEPIGAVAAPNRYAKPGDGAQQLLVQKAVAILGGQSELARAIGVSQPNVSKMCRGRQSVSAEIAKAIDTATDGKITHWQLRPDLWDAPQPEPVELSV